MKYILFTLFIIFIAGNTASNAQFTRYIIQLKDKTTSPYSINNPLQFITQRAIDRRKRYNINIDQTDIPVISAYIDSIKLSGNVTILNVSKWFNQVCIQTNDIAALQKINAFSFVQSSTPVAARIISKSPSINKLPDITNRQLPGNNERPLSPTDYYNYGQSFNQIHLNNTEFLHNHGFRGDGMQLSIMDAGFYHYLTLPTFDSIRNNNQILGTWDYVANKQSVNEEYQHGMYCLSTIAANLPGVFVGTAPKTSFYLFRTEDVSSEYPVEEQNWVAAAERADSLGVDVCSVSLGYTTFDSSRFDNTYANMDGHTTIMARAANLAAQKGLMVVVAAGNEGANSWHYISTPADADSALAVGAVSVNGLVANFSGFGPNSSGQVKPDVAAVGVNAVVANTNSGYPMFGNGTSYACPITAGLATCLWQAFTEVNNMGIIDALHKSGDKYLSPDNRTGYGIPDVKKAFVSLIKKLYSQNISIGNNCAVGISLTVKTASDMNIIIERKLPADPDYTLLTTKNSGNINFTSTIIQYADDLKNLPANIAIKYRIKMTIAADTSFYLDSTTINNNADCAIPTAETMSVSPNPVANNLSVLITRNKTVNASIEVFATNGQKVYNLLNQQMRGSKTFLIPMQNLSSGVYFVTVFIDDKKVLTKKVIR